MAVMRYIVPALAVAGRAAAQCSAATTTIQSAGDASALASCTTFTGSIAIATGTTDNIALDGIQQITGSLIADNVTQITEISGDSLETITEMFYLNGLTILSTLNFPRLTNVESIDWVALPALQGLSFTTGVQTASQVSIVNTELNTLDGIDLAVVDTLLISNNDYLNEINMQLGNISTALTIEANGRNVSATFPDLDWAFNMTFRNVSSVSIPSLASLNGSMGFYSNSFATLNAPNLTSVGGSLTFVDNADLTTVSMPELTIISGGFTIANNSQYTVVDGYPKLATVGGAVEFNGAFTNVTLPSITDVRGAFNIESTGDISSSCAVFKPLSNSGGSTNNPIHGTYQCKGESSSSSSTGSSGSSATGTSSGSSSTSTKKSSASGFVAQSGYVTGVMGVIAAMFGML